MYTFNTLNNALDVIAQCSFYEGKRVTKRSPGEYVVEEWYSFPDSDSIEWTYSGGVELHHIYGLIDYTRLMMPGESLDSPSHVSYNLPLAVEAIDRGTPVGFTYCVAHDIDECQNCLDSDCCECDRVVGWLLVATDETTH